MANFCKHDISYLIVAYDRKTTSQTRENVNEEPHTHWRGMLEGNKPYRSARASLKAPLCKQNPNSSMGSQFELHGPPAGGGEMGPTASDACSCRSFRTAVLTVL